MQKPLTVAYFTMEIALRGDMPTFAGGLGVLAADIVRSMADLQVPGVAVTCLWQHGYLHQEIHGDGTQAYSDIPWEPATILQRLLQTVTVTIEGREVTVGVWLYEQKSGDHIIPVFFLDTNLPENRPDDRLITNHLYGGGQATRIRQELVLGVGGVRMLRALGYADVGTYHMNEGHCAFLTLELLRERDFRDENVRQSCAFTTHTPVAAGHDVFPYDAAWKIAGDNLPWHIKSIAGEDALSMTRLAMAMSRGTFAVSRIHRQVSRKLLRNDNVDYITNGVHHLEWLCPEMAALFDAHIKGWRGRPQLLMDRARTVPDADLWHAHESAKKRLLDHVHAATGIPLDLDRLTIVSARRVVPYKRPELLYTNIVRLREVACGKLQIIHAGNAHPHDPFSQEVIRHMVERSKELRDCVKIVYLPNYNPELAKLLVAGADVWLNTPMRLHEASGTSGMKACLNGVLNLSTLDGWWIEGYEMDPQAGWRIGPLAQALDADDTRQIDAEDLYTQLQYQVIPEFQYPNRERWIRRMKRAISLMGHFNAQRCVEEYLGKAWGELPHPGGVLLGWK
ncbi:MAG: starch phosphorylase [Candidatus Peregrinibacteria bacterium Greene0416_19]|nr:MAG: starch phosphorylase [Candidatus Peregrinibacteria bacterium Greene0416_19]